MHLGVRKKELTVLWVGHHFIARGVSGNLLYVRRKGDSSIGKGEKETPFFEGGGAHQVHRGGGDISGGKKGVDYDRQTNLQ